VVWQGARHSARAVQRPAERPVERQSASGREKEAAREGGRQGASKRECERGTQGRAGGAGSGPAESSCVPVIVVTDADYRCAWRPCDALEEADEGGGRG